MVSRSTTLAAEYAFLPLPPPVYQLTLIISPIPLDLLTLGNFTDPPTLYGNGLLRSFGGNKGGDAQENTGLTPNAATDWRVMFPCTILYPGRLGGLYTLYAESSPARTEWKEKLKEAIELCKGVQESDRVFKVETISSDTFVSWNSGGLFTGKVTCSVPLSKKFDFEIRISRV
jgi:hypothetical protein